MKQRVRVAARAKLEIREAATWYDDKGEGLGAEFVDKVEEALDRIRRHPLQYAVVIDDLRRVHLDRFPYSLWYVVEPSGQIVFTCLHFRRNTPKLAREHRRESKL